MTPEQHFHELLHLGTAWRVVKIGFHPDGGVQLRVEETEALWRAARSIHVENGAVRCYDHVEDVTWRQWLRAPLHHRLPPAAGSMPEVRKGLSGHAGAGGPE